MIMPKLDHFEYLRGRCELYVTRRGGFLYLQENVSAEEKICLDILCFTRT